MSDEPKLPRGERVCIGYNTIDHEPLFILTNKRDSSDWFYLYELVDGEYRKLGRARTPPELEAKYHVNERLRKQ